MYAWELFMSYLVVHVLYIVVENLAATDCLGREQVVRYALPSPKLVRKFRLRDGTAYWALQGFTLLGRIDGHKETFLPFWILRY